MSKTKIEWADLTVNPVVGCSKCSPGCDNCYAERFAVRMVRHPNRKNSGKYRGVVDERGRWTGKIGLALDGCFADLHSAKRAKRVFIGSMGDLFHENVPQSEVLKLINAMSLMPQHTFLLLTKRPERARDVLDGILGVEGFGHVWLGVTVCNQNEASAKISVLLDTPAAKRFVSVEPMLGPVNLGFRRSPTDRDYSGWNGDGPISYVETVRVDQIHWVICGGETGPGARPMHPEWVRSLRDQCVEAGAPFFFKGWGEWMPVCGHAHSIPLAAEKFVHPDGTVMSKVKQRCRLLDRREWNEVPE